MKRVILIAVAALALLVVVVWTANYIQLQAPMKSVIDGDPRNEGISVRVHYGNYVNPNVLVYDLRSVSGDNSRIDVMRVMLQYAHRIQEKDFGLVELSYRGARRFTLDGGYFRSMGRDYDFQNPVYTLRTFPENVMHPEGSPAFGTWSGGLLGVVGEQMNDLNRFHDQWYLNEVLRND